MEVVEEQAVGTVGAEPDEEGVRELGRECDGQGNVNGLMSSKVTASSLQMTMVQTYFYIRYSSSRPTVLYY